MELLGYNPNMAGGKFGSFFLSIFYIAGTIILVSNASPTVSSSSVPQPLSASPSFPWPLLPSPEPPKIISPSPAPFPSPIPAPPSPSLPPLVPILPPPTPPMPATEPPSRSPMPAPPFPSLPPLLPNLPPPTPPMPATEPPSLSPMPAPPVPSLPPLLPNIPPPTPPPMPATEPPSLSPMLAPPFPSLPPLLPNKPPPTPPPMPATEPPSLSPMPAPPFPSLPPVLPNLPPLTPPMPATEPPSPSPVPAPSSPSLPLPVPNLPPPASPMPIAPPPSPSSMPEPPSHSLPPPVASLTPPAPPMLAPTPPSPPPVMAPPPVLPSSGIKGGYWPSWTAETSPPSTIPTSYFTHLFYSFVVPDGTTYQLSITQPDHQWMGNFTATLHAKTPPIKALLAIGGANSSPYIFANMASNHDNRAAFIKSTITTAREYDFDGLDLDWEFPNSPQDMSSLSILFSEWHTAVVKEASATGKPRLLLSAAVYFASNFFLSDTPTTYPGDAIKKYVDFVNPMCYNYHGSWDISMTGAHALLYDKSSNISTSFGISSWIRNGVPPEKLVMGLPMYGRTWELKDPNEHGIGAAAVGVGPGNEGIIIYSDVVDFNLANNASVVYDEETVSTYSYVGTNWIGYDGPISIADKVEFAKAQGLGGYFLWALGYDKNWTLSRAASMAWDGTN